MAQEPPRGAGQEIDARRYEELRERLVDRTRRNRLLHFRHPTRGAALRIVDEIPDLILERLQEGKAYRLRPLPDPEDEPADERTKEFKAALAKARASDEPYRTALSELDPDDPSAQAKEADLERELKDRVREELGLPPRPRRKGLDPSAYARLHGVAPEHDVPKLRRPPDPKHADEWLQTLLMRDVLRARSATLHRQARAIEQETGVSTLHLAFGFLEWFESESSKEVYHSPLLLLPVGLERKATAGGEDEYRLVAVDDEPTTNLSLELRLRDDFQLTLPTFDAEARDPVERYFAAVAEAVRPFKRWRIRRFVTLAPFSFARIAMYKDLDRGNWTSEGGPIEHPLVRPIVRGAAEGVGGDPRFAVEHDVDHPEVERIAPVLVHDADSSQHSAIIDAMRGENLVVEGPPGTGKSQTIANLIANFLHAGKTVLFVAEKMAALDVVKSRLDAVGLGEFCLTLHAAGAKPAAVIEALRKRDDMPGRVAPSEARTEASIRRARAELKAHLEAMHSATGPAGETVHALIGRIAELGRVLPHLPDLLVPLLAEVPSTVDTTAFDIAQHRLEMLEAASDWSGRADWNPSASPFRCLERHDLYPEEQDALLRTFAAMPEACRLLEAAAGELSAALAEPEARNLAAIKSMAERAASLSDPQGLVDKDLLPRLVGAAQRKEAAWVADRAEAADAAADLLRSVCPIGPSALDPGRLAAVDELAQRIGLADVRIDQVPALAREAEEAAAGIARIGEIARRIAGELGLGDDPDVATLRLACLAVGLVAELDPVWATHRRHGLERHLAALRDAADKRQRLAARKSEISAKLDVDAAVPDRLRHVSKVIAAAGWFARLGSEYRDAKRQFEHLWGAERGKPPHRREWPAMLEEAAEVLTDIESYAREPSLRSVLGPDLDPWRAPLADLAMAAEWQVKVHATLAGDRLEAAQLRTILITTIDAGRLPHVANLGVAARSLLDILDGLRLPQGQRLSAVGSAALKRVAALAELRGMLPDLGVRLSLTFGELHAATDALREWHAAKADLASERAHGALGGSTPHAVILRASLRFAEDVAASAPHAVERLLRDGWRAGIADLRAGAKLAAERARELEGHLDRLRRLGLPRLADAAAQRKPAEVGESANALAEAGGELAPYLKFAAARGACVRDGLAHVVMRAFEDGGKPFKSLPEALAWLVASAMVRRRAATDPLSFARTGNELSAHRRNFAAADRDRARVDARAVAAVAIRRPVPGGRNLGSKKTWTEYALLRNEFPKQKRHVPVRDLLGRARGAVLGMTPCLMMSPLTVAQFLRSGGTGFDVVVMDEASQIKPEDAVGALLRGKQAIIVGDPKQLPPTNFFDRALDDGEEEEGEGGEAPRLAADDKVQAESVLDLALQAFRPARRLRWHYRSRHESLIAFSNRQFYDDNLVVFPAAHPPSETLGIELVRVDGRWRDRVNVEEARAVAEAVAAFMREHPDLSHGVVAMNQPQRELIENEIDLLTNGDELAAAYREKWEDKLEPPFVKNLENVQGDERDVVFISLGWGRTPEGAMHQRFYPVNRAADGHRRLNVLFTRAKRKIVLFTSMDPEDVVVDEEKTARGVRVLRDYLVYARDGRLDAGDHGAGEAESPFETSVANALRARGHDVALQVGVAGYRIDLAVRHPQMRTRFVLGIECDGAAYHSAKSARDRDRLRQEALERLGWRLTRVWSTDWFRYPAAEADRLSAEIERAVAETPVTPIRASLAPEASLPSVAKPSGENPSPPLETKPRRRERGNGATHGVAGATAGVDGKEEGLAEALRRFRDQTVMAAHPGSDPERCILRDKMIDAIVGAALDDPDDFRAKVPEALRSATDGRQMRHLERICEIVSDHLTA